MFKYSHMNIKHNSLVEFVEKKINERNHQIEQLKQQIYQMHQQIHQMQHNACGGKKEKETQCKCSVPCHTHHSSGCPLLKHGCPYNHLSSWMPPEANSQQYIQLDHLKIDQTILY